MRAHVRCWTLLLVLGLGAAAVQADEVPVARFGGRVVDAEGRPVAGARLWLQVLRADGGHLLARNLGTADEEGRFAVEIPQTPIPYGENRTRPWPKRWRCLVAAWHPDHGAGWARADSGADIEVRMTRMAVLRGRVVGADGAPLADVPVGLSHLSVPCGPDEPDTLCLQWPEPHPMWGRARTDAEGRFEFVGLPVGASTEVHLRAFGPRGREWGAQWPPDPEEVTLSEHTEGVVINLVSTPVITGQLLLPDERGTPATHVSVMAIGRKAGEPRGGERTYSASVDDNGRYQLRGLQPGLYTIWADRRDYAVVVGRDIEVAAGQRLELPPAVLVPSGTAEGRVLDADTGEPVARAAVTVFHHDVPEVGGPEGRDGAACGPDGRYHVLVAPGTTFIVAYAGGYMASYSVTWERVEGSARARITTDERKPSSRELHPEPGQAITGMDLYLKRGAEVAGTVIGPDGDRWFGHPGPFPPSRERVMVSPDQAWLLGMRRASTGALIGPEGTFCARGLYPGVPVVLSVFDDDLEVGGAVRVTPELDRRTEVVIRLGPAAHVRGRVLMPDGKPAAGVAVGISGGYGRTDAAGRFDLAGGVPGLLCTVSADALPGADEERRLHGESKTVEVAPGQEVVDVGDIVLAPWQEPSPE